MTFYTKTSGFAANAAAPLAIDRPPVSRAFKFRSLTLAITPTNRHLSDKVGGLFLGCVDNSGICEILGTHMMVGRLFTLTPRVEMLP